MSSFTGSDRAKAECRPESPMSDAERSKRQRDARFLARNRSLADHDTRSSGRSDIIDIAAEKRGESEKAFRVFDGKRTEWVPKSQVQDNGDGTFAMPEWLAKEKGFI